MNNATALTQEIALRRGVAWRNSNSDWIVSWNGSDYPVKYGENGNFHPVLFCGRDENRPCMFYFSSPGVAAVTSLVRTEQ